MSSQLLWTPTHAGLAFRLDSGGQPLPFDEWARREDIVLPGGRAARIGPLLRLVEQGEAREDGDGLIVDWAAVADLSEGQLAGLGLPARAPYTLSFTSRGALVDAHFAVSYKWIGDDGIPRMGIERQGCLLTDGSRTSIVPNPLYEIVEAIGELNAGAGGPTERMLAWGRIAEKLPADADIGGDLKTFRIAVASAFRIEPFVNEQREPDFRPALGRLHSSQPRTETEIEEPAARFEEVLSKADQAAFATRFRGLSKVKPNHPLGGNSFVVLAPEVLPIVGEVRRILDRPPAERRRFLLNPSQVLREALEEAGVQVELDEVFHDEGLSERVRGIGIWEPRVLPWVKVAGQPWLPPEAVGLLIGGERIEIEAAELPSLVDKLEQAIREGRSAVEHGGRPIPATDGALESARSLAAAAKSPSESLERAGPDRDGRPEKVVLLIHDNLEDATYEARERRRPGRVGEPPALLKSSLLPHQIAGLEWLQRHWTSGSTGALLADDMGLGKTFQALAFLAWAAEAEREAGRPQGPILIVAPTGLLKNWKQEHGKHLHAPGLGEPLELFGAGLRALRRAPAKAELETGAPTLDLGRLSKADWALTTYETLRDYQHSFARIPWMAAVFDEAQKIKNPAAAASEAAKAMNIRFVLTMTGTPVENRVADVWPIVDRAKPGKLGTLKEFSRRYEAPGDEAALRELKAKLTENHDAPAIMLRRMKEDHLEGLPERHFHRRVVEMPQEQAQAYSAVVESAARAKDMLTVLHGLRAVSLHPRREPDGRDDYIAVSARLAETFRILDEISVKGEKALVFCEALEMQDFLAETLPRRYGLPGPVRLINGGVAGAARQERVNEFQSRRDFDVMLLTPRAGGVGLTLTAANHVIHLSRWWNPAVEDQCSDRVYRIGQEREVHVYTPIARHPKYGEHSFDERLDGLLQRKRSLSRELLAPADAGKEDLEGLYRDTVESAQS